MNVAILTGQSCLVLTTSSHVIQIQYCFNSFDDVYRLVATNTAEIINTRCMLLREQLASLCAAVKANPSLSKLLLSGA
jgi:hypothetical protein